VHCHSKNNVDALKSEFIVSFVQLDCSIIHTSADVGMKLLL